MPDSRPPPAKTARARASKNPPPREAPASADKARDCLAEIIDLLLIHTAYDFNHYKRGTLQRRVARRMALAAIPSGDTGRYLDLLLGDGDERAHLAKDLLINVTRFFRDVKTFDFLARTVIPELIHSHPLERPLRIWIAGCSTGEEAYSLAMLFHERIETAKRTVRLQILACDVDADAIARARKGFYPDTIQADVSPDRLARFFSHEGHGYRIGPELRAAVTFAVQDVLADPPDSGFDLVSCRNLLIYLRPEGQAKALSFFHLALRDGGVLLLGSSESIGDLTEHFEAISASERLYRHRGRSRDTLPPIIADKARMGRNSASSRQAVLAELSRRLVTEAFAPAAVLVNLRDECLYSLGPTDRYLCVAPGQPTHNLIAMARPGVAPNLQSAIRRARGENARIALSGGQMSHDGKAVSFSIDVQPVISEGEELLLICFVDEPQQPKAFPRAGPPHEDSRIGELERELDSARAGLQNAIHNLDVSREEQRKINEDALSINEEYQSANDELLNSKEEMSIINSHLQETMEQWRTTSNDLQNILYSTDVATLFLDTDLHIRFFTPATKSLFNVIPGDIGRPLAELTSLAADAALPGDACSVLRSQIPIEREIESNGGTWFIRRILPYRTHDNGVEGVVITFTDITERKHVAKALEAATRQAELANVAKSRFLAAASHDLRQPLQTLALLHGLLAKTVVGERAQKLVARLDQTLGAMSGMLNTLLDINQIEAGTVCAEMTTFPINDLLESLSNEFTYLAQAQDLALRMVPCSLWVHSDPRLLEQMIRNLLSNALKYTRHGAVLLGCRRRGRSLSIEIWDTGIGIPEDEQYAIFEEYHQLDNAARERGRGLGLGLSIVRRLGNLLNHPVQVRSHPGKGSVFAIAVPLPSADMPPPERQPRHPDGAACENIRRSSEILVIEDDPQVRELLEILLADEGHRAVSAPDGIAALELVAHGTSRPDIVLSDYNLPNGMNGLKVVAKLRETLHRQLPVIILTGDISTQTLRSIAAQNCLQLNKPVKLAELTKAIQVLLPKAPAPTRPFTEAVHDSGAAVIFVVDDDQGIRDALRSVLEDDGRIVEDYGDCESFLEAYRPGRESCLLIDAYLPGMNGVELLHLLRESGHKLPAIMITGDSDVPMAVRAMKAGAVDFIEKPVGCRDLLVAVERALEQSRDAGKLLAWRDSAAHHVAALTPRQRQIMDLVLAGHPSKNIAADLGISQRTVENHRASIMKRTGSKSLPALARVALAAVWNGTGEPLS